MFTAIFWKKVWTWVKHYWYWPVIIVLLICASVAGRSSRGKLFNLLEKQKENYDKEIEIIKETAEDKEARKIKIFEEFLENADDAEVEKKRLLSKLDKEKEQELQEIIKKNKNKPEDLAKEIAKILSASYHENNR